MTLVIIPARMNSTRLPGKPLEWIGSKTLIERCALQAEKAGFEPIVATDSDEIANHLRPIGVKTVMTGECASGSDRVAAAAEIVDPDGHFEFVVNMQGDMPYLNPKDLSWFCYHMEELNNDLQTAYCDVGYVEVGYAGFERKSVESHIGLYGFSRKKLREFARTPRSEMEIKLDLEQCRFPFDEWEIVPFKTMPIEINTQADLDRARSCLM